MTSSLLSPQTTAPRRAAWLLALSPLPFVLWLVAVVATLAGTGVDNAADLTPQQMDTIRVGWMLQWPLYAAAVVLGVAALAVVHRSLPARVAAAVSVAAILGSLVLVETATGFDEARLGDNGAYRVSVALSYAAIWAALVAVVLAGVHLYRGGGLRRTGRTVAILAAVILVADVLTRGFPPFVVALLWLPLGIGLLRRRVPSGS